MITSMRRRGSGQSRSNGVVSVARELRGIEPTVPGKRQTAESRVEPTQTLCTFERGVKQTIFFFFITRRNSRRYPRSVGAALRLPFRRFRAATAVTPVAPSEGNERDRPSAPPASRHHHHHHHHNPWPPRSDSVGDDKVYRTVSVCFFFPPFSPLPSPPHSFARRRPCTERTSPCILERVNRLRGRGTYQKIWRLSTSANSWKTHGTDGAGYVALAHSVVDETATTEVSKTNVVLWPSAIVVRPARASAATPTAPLALGAKPPSTCTSDVPQPRSEDNPQVPGHQGRLSGDAIRVMRPPWDVLYYN